MNRFGSAISVLSLLAAAALSFTECGTQKKIRELGEGNVSPGLSMSGSYDADLPEFHIDKGDRDTLVVEDVQGRKYLLMNAIKDENGEMTANEVLQAAVVTARFRNIAERHGMVDIRFEVTVPPEMTDSKWQLRFNPRMDILGENVLLDPVIITGKGFRAKQLRGYERYRKFLDGIVADTSIFVNRRNLEVFIKRNIPELYALKTDSTYISDDRFASIYGVTAKEAMDHYTNGFLVRRNNRRIASKDKMFRKYVKSPIVTSGIRLDTVLTDPDGQFVYEYVQSIATRARLKKVDVVLAGEIFEEDRKIYTIPESEPLTYYISSISTLLDPQERYLTKVISRQAEANTTCRINFNAGSYEIDPSRGDNRQEIKTIESILGGLLENREYDLDSITVTASCSPEGSFRDNGKLARNRAGSVSKYFESFVRHYRDSLTRNSLSYDLDGTYKETRRDRIRFMTAAQPENWELLASLVASDEELSEEQRSDFAHLMDIPDLDGRELALQQKPYYGHLLKDIYPLLRTVEFRFMLHRKGMIKDTVHTTVLDTAYMKGLKALQDRDYPAAVKLLRPYSDYNAAVACCASDLDATAMSILENLKPDDRVEYLLAILYSRKGDDQAAVQHYLNAVALDRSYIHRGNLDPEISVLIRKYGLNRD